MKSPVTLPFALSDWRAVLGFVLAVIIIGYAIKYLPVKAAYKPF